MSKFRMMLDGGLDDLEERRAQIDSIYMWTPGRLYEHAMALGLGHLTKIQLEIGWTNGREQLRDWMVSRSGHVELRTTGNDNATVLDLQRLSNHSRWSDYPIEIRANFGSTWCKTRKFRPMVDGSNFVLVVDEGWEGQSDV